jgi:hypothetical protein
MFFWTFFLPNELVCTLLWRMCIVVTSTMLYPLTLVLLSLLVRPFLKYRLSNYISCFPPTILLACGSRCKPSKFSQLCPHFQHPDTPNKKKKKKKKKKDSNITNDICLLAGSQLSIAKQDKPKMNTNPKKEDPFPTYWRRHNVCPLLLLYLWVCMCKMTIQKQHNIWNASWKKSSRCHYKLKKKPCKKV